jgi:hypothetical protein
LGQEKTNLSPERTHPTLPFGKGREGMLPGFDFREN